MLRPQRSVPARTLRFPVQTCDHWGGSYRQVLAVETPFGRYRAGMVAEG